MTNPVVHLRGMLIDSRSILYGLLAFKARLYSQHHHASGLWHHYMYYHRPDTFGSQWRRSDYCCWLCHQCAMHGLDCTVWYWLATPIREVRGVLPFDSSALKMLSSRNIKIRVSSTAVCCPCPCWISWEELRYIRRIYRVCWNRHRSPLLLLLSDRRQQHWL